MPTTTTLVDDLIQIEREELSSDSLQEGGVEVSLDDLLEDVISSEDDRWQDEKKLQELYKDTPFYQRLQARLRAAAMLGKKIELGEAVVCDKCHNVYEVGDWPLCGEGIGREHGRVTPRAAQSNTVTAYFINHLTGKIWIPGSNNRTPIDRTGKPIAGYERLEVRNFRERDKFYKLMDQKAKEKYFSNLRREQQHFDPVFSEGRKQARQDIISSENSSPEASYGRDWLQKMIDKTEKEAAKKLNYNPNTFIDAWEHDQANLDDAGLSSLNSTLLDKQPLLSDRHKKAIGRSVARKQTSKGATT
jgi:hypothetical protein